LRLRLGVLGKDGVEAHPSLTLVSPAVNQGSQSLKGVLAIVFVSVGAVESPTVDRLAQVLGGLLAQGSTRSKLLRDAHRAAIIGQIADADLLQLWLRLGFGLIMAQIDIDPGVVFHPHIQLVAVQPEGEWSGTYFTVDLN